MVNNSAAIMIMKSMTYSNKDKLEYSNQQEDRHKMSNKLKSRESGIFLKIKRMIEGVHPFPGALTSNQKAVWNQTFSLTIGSNSCKQT